jgi:3-polyprenyl-4-hydroxybenzoate decarboxylase
MAFDATRKLPGEGYHRVWPELVKMPAEIVARVEAMRRTL